MRRTLPAALLLTLAAGTAAACSSAAPNAAAASAAPSATVASNAPADGGTYPNADAVLAALQTDGAPCTNPAPVANPTAPGALSMVDCTADTDGDTVVAVFDSQQDAQSYAESMTQAGPLAAQAVVYGKDWAVNTTTAYAPRVQIALGGGTLDGPSPSAS